MTGGARPGEAAAGNPPAASDEAAIRAAWPALFGDPVKGGPGGALPARDVDLAPFIAVVIDRPAGDTWPSRRKALVQHFRMLEPEFGGRSRLAHLLASVIVVLRRHPGSGHARILFERITREQGATVAAQMNLRWLTSVCDTFCDFGDPQDRALGLCGTLVANLVKLMETERRMFAPPRPWPPQASFVAGGKLFDGMICYWIGGGDMIRNLLGRADSVLASDSPAAPFVREILLRLREYDTVLARMIEISDGREIPLADKARLRELRRLLADL